MWLGVWVRVRIRVKLRVRVVVRSGAVPSFVAEAAVPPALSSSARLVACSAALATCTCIVSSKS